MRVRKGNREPCLESSIERRKVIAVGRGMACMVTLPKQWTRAMHLGKADTVDIVCFKFDSHFLSLIPSAYYSARKRAIILGDWSSKCSENECMKINRKILAAYLVGYETICIRNRSGIIPVMLKASILKFVEAEIQFASVWKNAPQEVEIRAPHFANISIEERVSQMHMITQQVFRETLHIVRKFSEASARSTLGLNDTIYRLCHEAIRLINLAAQNPKILVNMGLRNYRDLMGFDTIVRSIESCADCVNQTISYLVTLSKKERKIILDPKTQREIESFGNSILNLFATTMEILSTIPEMDYDRADKVIEKLSNITKELNENTFRTDETATVVNLQFREIVLDFLKRIGEHTKTVADVTRSLQIDSAVQET